MNLLRILLFSAIFVWGLSTQYSIGYGMYINTRFVGIVHSHAEAKAIVDIISAESRAPALAPSLYLRFLPRDGFSAASEVLANARAAGGIETEIVTDTVSIPFPTENVEDTALYEGEEAVTTEGVPGSRVIVKQITRLHGQFLREEVISDSVSTAPVPQVTTVGTRPKPQGVGTGSFILPLSEITVSSGFGSRWGRTHAGLDLAASKGTSILAADSGTVTFSGECEGYGNLIIIDHQNGFTTYYAHCSVLYAAVGARPEKGEVIAAVGSTGNSTGPHLHFEIRKDDEPLNPSDYLPGNFT